MSSTGRRPVVRPSALRAACLLGAAAAALATASLAAPADAQQKPGVVEKCSVVAKRVYRDVKDAIGRLFAKPSSTNANVAVIEDDGTLLERTDINLCGVARVFYKTYADDRHLLFVFGQGSANLAGGYNAYYQSLRNDVRGIGRALEDRSASCGSKGALLGFANMNGAEKWKNFLNPLLDIWPLGVITHELGHQWIAFIDQPIKGVQLTTNPRSALRSHWQPLVHTDASIMYGNAWKKVPFFDAYVSTKLPSAFSPLDKYLMGIHGPERVPPFFAINAKKSKIWKHFAMPGNTAKGKAVTISIGDVQAAAGGARVPDWRAAQKRFKAAFVLVVPKGQKARPDMIRAVEYFRKRIPQKLRAETDGAFTIETELAASMAMPRPAFPIVPAATPVR